MNPTTAFHLANELMTQHGLQEWTFVWDRAKRRFGQCRYVEKQISLSRPLVALNSETQVRDTILHEIAHALAGAGHGHSKHWKEVAASIGAEPHRCYGPWVKRPRMKRRKLKKYRGKCPSCGRLFVRTRQVDMCCGGCFSVYKPEFKIVWLTPCAS